MVSRKLWRRRLRGVRLTAITLCLTACTDSPRSGTPDALPRVVEARLPIDLVYRPCPPRPSAEGLPSPRCGERLSPAEKTRIVELVSNWGRKPSPQLSIAAAVTLSPSSERLRDLIDRLRAESRDSEDGGLGLALGAAEHTLARVADEPAWLVDAFEHTAEALARDPASDVGLFNRALIATDLGLCRVAGETWRRFLDLDRSSPWADEARERLGSLPCLGALPADDGRHPADVLFEQTLDELLPRWVAADDRAARDQLSAELCRRGEELANVAGDPALRQLAGEIDAAEDPRQRQAIAAYTRGRAAFKAGDLTETRRQLAEAQPVLRHQLSMLAPWCDVWLAGTEIAEARYAAAKRRLVPYLESSSPDASPSLKGRLLWTLGLAALREGRLEAAFDRFAEAEGIYQRAGYSAAAAAIRILKATTSRNLGFFRPSWSDWTRGMRALQAPRPRLMLHNGLLEGATAAQLMGAEATAKALLREAAAIARANDDRISEIETLLWQGRLLREQGEHDLATNAFQQALEAARPIPHEYARVRFTNMARLGLWTDPRRSEAGDGELQGLVDALAGTSRTLHLRALRGKAAVERRHGDVQAALATLRTAIGVIRTQQQSLGSERLKLSYLESRQGLFDDAIVLALAEGRSLEALRLLEAARQLEADAPAAAELLPDLRLAADAGTATLPTDQPVVVVFGLLGETFAWWRIERDLVRAGVGEASELTPLARSVVENAPAGRVSDKHLEDLYRILLAEPLRGVRAGRPLILVPDGVLQQIPYAALRNPASGRRLIEERPLSFRSDLGEALRPPEALAMGGAPRAQWRVVTVGDPAFDAVRLPWLPRLPGAREEARRIAELYPGRAVSLIDEAATAERLRQELPSRQILHLAGHATAGPAQDAIVLARDAAGSSGLAVADDLLGGTTSLRLVVLSACSTLGRRPSRSGGLMGIARTFVARGVTATVGTLWPIADRPQAELMVGFHRGLRRGLAASEALRQAQLELLRKEPPVDCCDWAAVQILGDLPAEATELARDPRRRP